MREHTKFSWLVVWSAVLGTGCYEEEIHYENAVIEEQVEALTVDVGSGDIILRGDEVSDVTIEAKIQGFSNHFGHDLENGHLTLFDECNEGDCSVDLKLFVP